MMTKDEALKMAIKAMENEYKDWSCEHGFHNDECPNEECEQKDWFKAINACKEALEQPAQEPVAKMVKQPFHDDKAEIKSTPMVQWLKGIIPPIDTLLYTHPHQWQGLTDDEIWAMISKLDIAGEQEKMIAEFVRAIEAKLKEKNNG